MERVKRRIVRLEWQMREKRSWTISLGPRMDLDRSEDCIHRVGLFLWIL